MDTNANSTVSEMSFMQKLISVFTAPRSAFESINARPSWFVPYLITVAITIALQYAVMDITMQDQLAIMEAKDMPAEQMDAVRTQMEGPMKYIGIAMIPIATVAVWVILGGIFLLAGNIMITNSEEVTFKKMLALVSWSSLITIVAGPLRTLLVISKGTMRGVATDLSVLLPVPAIGEDPSLLYLLLSKIDVFVIWQIVLWIIGFSVFYRVETKKAAVPVLTLWAIWIVVSVAFSSFFGQFGM
ncbi:MAG TPA: YIP1 family protein [Caldithrix abyssi]|uniref:YIP1 family protein n=1 Tax=Caldithrix abyssi TaxID=187145 RepID=A0A7V4WWZ6_CALAY|nr:YIP1 family protein [Caldithrix abyssi]